MCVSASTIANVMLIVGYVMVTIYSLVRIAKLLAEPGHIHVGIFR